jgi:hypothetical protein
MARRSSAFFKKMGTVERLRGFVGKDDAMATVPTPEPTPNPPPPPIHEPVREPDPDRLPDEIPLPNPDENDAPPKHADRTK